jgi:uncharacterized protein YukE
MFGQSGYSHAMSNNVRQIERRLRSLEQRVKGAGGGSSASAAEAAERVANAVAPLLNRIADQFRDGANSMSDEAAKLSNDGLRRLSNEAKHRPLAAVAVAAGGHRFGRGEPTPLGCCARSASRAITPPPSSMIAVRT